MGDSFATTIGFAAHAHTGDGPQNNYHYTYYNAPGPESPRLLVRDHLRRLADHYVQPAEYRTARSTLHTRGMVLIRGEAGSGRRATAQMLLHTYGEQLTALREIPPENGKGQAELSREGLGIREGLLLDLAHIDRESWNKLQRELPSFHQAVQNNGSKLVVVLPLTADGRLDDVDLQQHAVTITRPDSMAVLRRALSPLGEPALPPDPPPEELTRFLNEVERLNEVAHLAAVIEEQWLLRRSTDPSQVCKDAVDGLLRTADNVTDQLREISWAHHKALLLSTAMLERGRPSAVSALAAGFLHRVKQPEEPAEPLARSDLSEQFEIIDAQHDPDGKVRFNKPGFASAVRAHYWDYRPWLRQTMRAWVIDTITHPPPQSPGPSLDDNERAALIESFTGQLMRTESVDGLTAFASALARHDSDRSRTAAVDTLRQGLNHPPWERAVRQQLYTWSRSTEASASYLDPVLIATCSGPLAERFPDQALVRLHHVARRSGQDRAAVRAIRDLVAENVRIHGLLFDRLADGLRDQSPQTPDVGLFLEFSAPNELLLPVGSPGHILLASSASAAKSLAKCWGKLLREQPTPVWGNRLETWLTAVHEATSRDAEQLLDILMNACGDNTRSYGLLYRVARRHSLRSLVLQRINQAQGYRTTPTGP
ncbi:hypothetical protein HUT18_02850 [Streptomyces sp. NA04227]|uniref:hypothetical protein n=1 Tax=Streptomyces sp. NA04227 TaxID=2742136 RepID=UPI00158FCC3B|nr:hypothetical protein [Streptomyces sp. NA04227]QKW05474.1 hypothetical protein HUT18_02850 [Streptomyces sp. NA04227]